MRFVALCVAIVGALAALPSAAAEDPSSIAAACRPHRNAIALIRDQTVLCFDGSIIPGRNAAFDELKQEGVFVVRSNGGFAPEAMRLADILRDKNATVIVYDYCLSACANYFLVATQRTFVLKNAIVAWHGGPFTCSLDRSDGMHQFLIDNIGLIRADFRKRFPEVPQSAISPDTLCAASDMSSRFFTERDIDDRHVFTPMTAHTDTAVRLARKRSAGQNPFWMWHPHNHGDYFKSRVVYESYPGSQNEVDALLARSRLRDRVIYDPPQMP